MTYGDMIEKIMPEVQSGSAKPFLIYYDAEGGWHGDFTKNQYGETFEWVADAINADKAAFVTCGLDFAGGSYPYVYDKVLCQRMSNEYYIVTGHDTDDEHKKTLALLNFFEDNVTEFSSETLDFLIDYDRPLKALTGFCPFNMATGHEGWTFNEDLAPDAVDAIEQRVASIINTRKLALGETELDEAELNKQTQRDVQAAIESGELGGDTKRVIDGYTEKFSVALAGREVILAVDDTQDVPYLVCTAKWDNAFGVTEYTEGAVTYDYIDAMRDFVDRVDTLLGTLEQERASFMTVQPTLTAADCVKGGLDADLKGKVVVIKPDVLSPEYRTANHQLKIVQGGFGASPTARGNAVFCKDLYSDKETRFERYDIAGVVDPAKLPQWAKDKLALAEAIKEPSVFAFGGYHFAPHRKFDERDGDFVQQMHNAASDHEMGIATYDWGKAAYSHADFYDASGESEADIFRCVENGKVYIPSENELFAYNDEPTPMKAVEEKYAEARLNKECGNAIDAALGAVRTPGELAGTSRYDFKTALANLNGRFGEERVTAVLAAIIANNDSDGRYSNANKKWSAGVFDKPVDALKYCDIKTHQTVLDGLVSKVRETSTAVQKPAPPKPARAVAEPPKKPSILGDLDASIKEAAQLAERKGGGHTKKRGDLEVK
ncbi:hypothetical protein FACS189425_02750 [Clostridia bacterium]|nr:hypothetical protein FACS189425_02750 [Clostridia bacterium]